MKSRLVLFLLLSAPFLASSVDASGLTNQAVWTWTDASATFFWTNSTQTVTNLYRFHVITPGFDPDNPYPVAGETLHIPVTIQNVGGEPINAFSFLPGFSGSWVSNWSVTSNLGAASFGAGDSNAFAFGALAPGGAVYLWVNVTIRTGLAAGYYPFTLTNDSGDFPYVEVLSNSLQVYLQNVTVASAHDGGHTIDVFDGSGFLGDRDVSVDVLIAAPPTGAWVYYDVGKDPDGAVPDGSLTNNRRIPLVLRDGLWRAVIPSSDPEIVTGAQVRFIVVVDGRIYDDGAGGPLLYGVGRYYSQPDEQDGPLILTSNAGDLTVQPVRLLYSLSTTGHVNITVYNLRGEIIRLVRDERLEAGPQADAWDGRNDAGREVSEGLYFISIHAPGLKAVRKVLFVKR